MKDIETREDLEKLLTEFYKIVIPDPELGHHFIEMDLKTHLPVIVDFWEKILFDKPIYFGNPLYIHQKLHEKFPLKPEHFHRWVEIFIATIDEKFAGEQAENAKLRAKAIADSLNQRLNHDPVKIISRTAN
jgi:hemoglobin